MGKELTHEAFKEASNLMDQWQVSESMDHQLYTTQLKPGYGWWVKSGDGYYKYGPFFYRSVIETLIGQLVESGSGQHTGFRIVQVKLDEVES